MEFYVVIDYGDGGDKIAQIMQLQKEQLERGERASEIMVIDATPKLSASKRT